MELNTVGKKLKERGLKYKDISVHYRSEDYVNLKKWMAPRGTRNTAIKQTKINEYTGEKLKRVNTQVDHMVSKADAHYTGGVNWSSTKKRAFGHWMENLVPTDNQTNMLKGAKSAPKWQPKVNKKTWADAYIATKKHWGLGVLKGESKVLKNITGKEHGLKIVPPIQRTKTCLTCHVPNKRK